MLRSLKIGKLFGIPLYLHTTFFLLPVWMLLTNRGIGTVNALFLLLCLTGVFSCVVLHELGHALMARYFGIGTESITLFPIGGVARADAAIAQQHPGRQEKERRVQIQRNTEQFAYLQ